MSDGDTWFRESYPLLLEQVNLSTELVVASMEALIAGRFEDWQAAAFLTALRMKRESGTEIAAATRVLRHHMITLPTHGRHVLDTCGTGGDGSSSFNISTVAALVVAGCGVPVVKHGNRSVSSNSGSADVLATLGVPTTAGIDWAQTCLNTVNFAFCFAPTFHPAMANVAKLRRKLGVRTLFNLLGPLCNPAGATYQLLGVGRAELFDRFTDAVIRLALRRAVLVHSFDGLDEVSLSAPTRVRIVASEGVREMEWRAADFGLESAPLEQLQVDGPEQSAEIINEVLAGVDGAPRRIVLANAAAALFAADRVTSPIEGVELAKESIDSGRAAAVLDGLRRSAPSE